MSLTAIGVLVAYLFAGLITAAIIARHLELDPDNDADLLLAVSVILFWPLATAFGSLVYAASIVIRAARGDDA